MSLGSFFMGIFSTPPGSTPAERVAELHRLTAIVDKHAASWPEVGAALKRIHDAQLYRETHSTWLSFLQEHWQMSEVHAKRLMDASTLHARTLPTGKAIPTERLARPLMTLPESDQVDAWQEAVQLAAGDPVRPEHVDQAVSRRKPRKTKKPPKPLRFRVAGGTIILQPNKSFTTVEDMINSLLRSLEHKRHAA